MHELPKVLFSAPLDEIDARDGEGFVVAVARGGELVLQFCAEGRRLATYSASRPPTLTLPRDAALDLAHVLLGEYDREASQLIEDTRQRGRLQLVPGGEDPENAA